MDATLLILNTQLDAADRGALWPGQVDKHIGWPLVGSGQELSSATVPGWIGSRSPFFAAT